MKKDCYINGEYLNELKDAGVPVLWRPYHEMNGVWLWWCNQKGENGFKKLWIMMYDYNVHHHKLDNLVFWGKDTDIIKEVMNDDNVLSKEDVTLDKNGIYHIIEK